MVMERLIKKRGKTLKMLVGALWHAAHASCAEGLHEYHTPAQCLQCQCLGMQCLGMHLEPDEC